MEIEIDNYPVADLPSRYELGKQQVYNRFVALGIKPSKIGKRAYITNAQLQSLDLLHAHISQGGLMSNFDFPTQPPDAENSPVDALDKTTGYLTSSQHSPKTRPLDTIDTTSGRLTKSVTSPLDKTTGIVENNLEALVNLIAAVSQTIATTIPTRSPIWYLSELEQAEKKGWMMTTSEIQQLIGVRPSTKGTTYQRGNFTFTKIGKIGAQTAWKVSKTE